MIQIGKYYTDIKFLEEYIKLYVKYITQDYIPCSTLDENGNLILSIIDKNTFGSIISTLNELLMNGN